LVIDANFRQPRIAALFPQTAGQGLSSALVGQADWRRVVHEVEPNFSVMSAGPMPPNPAELLGSDEVRRIIAEAATEYDQILFDAAPCLVVTDPSVLSTVVDGVIIVIRAGASTYGMVQRVREMLSRLGAHITGVVLNGVRVTAGGYLRKNYDRFYEYSESTLPELAAQKKEI
ncbi:MAG: CpsD/CapB family tyrosine-protein kinase, partial [Planctomycetota bacterium]